MKFTILGMGAIFALSLVNAQKDTRNSMTLATEEMNKSFEERTQGRFKSRTETLTEMIQECEARIADHTSGIHSLCEDEYERLSSQCTNFQRLLDKVIDKDDEELFQEMLNEEDLTR